MFNQPKLGGAKALIHGRYPERAETSVINGACDIMYFILSGTGTVHTAAGDFALAPHDALFIPRGTLYWVEGQNFKVLVISTPEWTAEQYKAM